MNQADVVFSVPTRYYHFDQQGVVFNMWYLAFLEEARNAYLDHIGSGLDRLLEAGLDIQVVNCRIDWTAPVRYGDEISVVVRPERIGRTSLTLGYSIETTNAAVATASSTYVVVGGRPLSSRPLPAGLRTALQREASSHDTVSPPSTGNSAPFR